MNEEKMNLLDRYFQQNMTEEELKLFKKEMTVDDELRAEWELRELAKGFFFNRKVEAMKRQHPTIVVADFEKQPVAKIVGIRIIKWGIAASVAIIIGFFFWQNFDKNKHNQALFTQFDIEDLYPKSQYALIDEGIYHKGIVESTDFEKLKKDGLKAFDAKQWDNAIALLQKYLVEAQPSEEETPDEINLMNLYLGRAYLEKGNLIKAIQVLQKAVAGVKDKPNHGLLQELMRWHLALAHLKNNDSKSAIKVLNNLQNAQHETIQKQTVKLLNKLK